MLGVRATLNALQRLLRERVVLGSVGVLQVHRRGFADNVSESSLAFALRDVDSIIDRIEKIPRVLAAAPRLDFLLMASVGDKTAYAPAVGIDPRRELLACPRRDAEWGDARVSAEAGIISPEMARELGTEHDSITLLASDADGVLNAAVLPITGVLGDNPGFSSEKKVVYLPLPVAQSLLRMPSQALAVIVRGDDPDHPEALAAAVQAALGARFEVTTWKQNAAFASDLLRAQDNALDLVIAVFVAVLLIGIVNAMLMNVLARTREIGMMMAVGMTRRKILTLFVLESTLLGGLGSLAGIVTALLVVWALARIGIPMRSPGGLHADILRPFVSARFVLVTAIGALVGGAAAAVYPARRAAQMRPVDALAAH